MRAASPPIKRAVAPAVSGRILGSSGMGSVVDPKSSKE
jgi:hypothetical protein